MVPTEDKLKEALSKLRKSVESKVDSYSLLAKHCLVKNPTAAYAMLEDIRNQEQDLMAKLETCDPNTEEGVLSAIEVLRGGLAATGLTLVSMQLLASFEQEELL